MSSLGGDVARRLVEARAISRIGGNPASSLETLAKGWVPKGDEPGVAGHLEALRAHLAATDAREDDSLILRYALTAPGTSRGIAPPLMVLDPDLNGFSDRRKREAAGAVKRLRDALDLGRAFVPGLSRETEEALGQLAALVAKQRSAEAPSAFDQFRGLSAVQARRVGEIAFRSLDDSAASVRELGVDLLRDLAAFRGEPLGHRIQQTLREKEIFWPGFLYREAGIAETRELLALVDRETDSSQLPHLLECLAWTRHDLAVEAFRDWVANPPEWAASLKAPLGDYPPCAGWGLNAKGERVELISESCHRLRPVEEGASGDVVVLEPIPETCPCCGGPLVALFDFTGVEAILPRRAPKRVICCLECAAYNPVFVAYRDDGTWNWLAPAEHAERVAWPGEVRRLVREPAESPLFAASNVLEMDDATAIGGAPLWWQSAEYPRCPRCGEWMRFLAQHDHSPLEAEGVHYAFYCPDCRISAVGYQQT